MNLKFFVVSLFFALAGFSKDSVLSSIKSLKVIQGSIEQLDQKWDLVILDFWASWCEPCKESFPFYESVLSKKKSKSKILFVSINLDENSQQAKDFLKKYPQNHLVLWDEKKKLMEQLEFDSIPFVQTLKTNGDLNQSWRGFNEKTQKKFIDLLGLSEDSLKDKAVL